VIRLIKSLAVVAASPVAIRASKNLMGSRNYRI
jgi:hypothetical protein